MAPGLRQDYTLTRLRGQLGPLMAEYVLGQVLVHERQWLRLAVQQRERRWEPGRDAPYRPLSTLTLLVLGGLGDLGQAVASAAKAFGMRVHVLARSRARPAAPEPPPVADAVFWTEDGVDAALGAALAVADYVVNVLPSTPSTRRLLTCAACPCLGTHARVHAQPRLRAPVAHTGRRDSRRASDAPSLSTSAAATSWPRTKCLPRWTRATCGECALLCVCVPGQR
jgi:hypothetical protein